MVSHLKRSKSQVKNDFIIFCDGFAERDEDHVVNPKQRDEQESGFSQPPGEEHKGTIRTIWDIKRF